MTEIGKNAESVVIDLLGGPSILRADPATSLDWAELIGSSVPALSADYIAHATGMDHADIARATEVPKRTLGKKQLDHRLSSDDSVRLLRLACVVARAIDVFEEKDTALDWLRSPNPALNRNVPLWMVAAKHGTGDVLLTLGRIRHGVFP